ncbi:MAG: 3-dehydroquinate synthase [Clostridia bacterium]|nr:3-dehydroquinate synthase [Clostridia bacterium]
MKKIYSETVPVKTMQGGYDVVMRDGALGDIGTIWDLDRRVMIVTDDGVPAEYARRAASACRSAHIVTLPQGESTKSEKYLSRLWKEAIGAHLTRRDAIVAVGGGVVGDLAGLAAATYMRGIDFYNVPTTVLSQVDSSVGGKCAIDFGGIKNIVGAFYQPRGVLLDGDLLVTLPPRHVSNGLAEAIKMAATFDAKLFSYIEEKGSLQNVTEIIREAVKIKIAVVEEDERESGIRSVLNFGHTAAHAIESVSDFEDVLHGEAVAIGMIPMTRGAARERLRRVLTDADLPTELPVDAVSLTDVVCHDKKMAQGTLKVVICPEIGKWEIVRMTPGEFEKHLTEGI